jgi:hypothetical protein
MNRLVEMTGRLLLAAVMSVLACGIAVADARAQGYAVDFDCHRSDGWKAVQPSENYAAFRDCGGAWLSGLKTYVVPHGDGRTEHNYSAQVFDAPPGTLISGIGWEGYKYFGNSSFAPFSGWAFKTGLAADNFREIDPEASCSTSNMGACYRGAHNDPNAAHVPYHEVRNLWDSQLAVYTACDGPNPCLTTSDGQPGHNFTRAGVVLARGKVFLADLTDPVISGVGGSATTGGWKRGNVDLTLSADDNSGICHVAAEAEGQRHEDPRPRDTMALQQCAGISGRQFTWNTTDWADGTHGVNAWVWDAAGRSVDAGLRFFRTDNNAPSAPTNLSIDGGDDWNQSNSRPIRWTNPGQGAGSPIANSQLRICKTGTSDCRTSDAGWGGVVTGVGGFDGPGDYTVRISLRDEAGNHSAGNLSNGVRLKFDNLAPGQALGARANGWLNAEERAAYQQRIDLKQGQFKPVSGIRGYSIATDGSDPDDTVEAVGEGVSYPINSLPEGVNTIKVRAVSNSGVGSASLDSIEVKIDLSKPTASVDGAPDPAKWQNRPVDLVLKGTDQSSLSGMGEGPGDKPIEEGAYIAYKVDGGELHKVRGAEAPVSVGDEGEHTVTYYAVDFAGNQSETQTVQFKIDRTSPTANAVSDSVDPQQWQRESVTVTLTGDDGAGKSGMDPAIAERPVEEGAHLAYRLDAFNTQKARGGAATFRVDADGDHTVTYYAVDGAGNESEHQEIRFRVDRTAPSGVVLEQQGADKRRIEVSADDATAGVGDVQIGIRRVGSIGEAGAAKRLARTAPQRYRRRHLGGTRRTGNRLVDCRKKRGPAGRACAVRRRRQLARHRIAALGEGWTMLPATLEGSKWVAYVPNERSLVEGVYQLQAVAQDRAGNESSGDKFRAGQPAIIAIRDRDQSNCCTDAAIAGATGGVAIGGTGSPLDLGADPGTVDTKVTAGVLRKVKVPRKVPKRCRRPKTAAQKKKCKKAGRPRYRDQFVNELKVKYGKKAKIKGTLTTAAGAPIEDGTIDVITTPNATGHLPQLVGAARTDRSGAFSYTAPAGSSRTVTFRFRGLGDYRRSQADVRLLVAGSATFKSSKKQVDNGQSVTFSGKLLGKPLPARGKVVDLQAFYRGKWRTFGTPRANKKGLFKFRYRFEATRTTTTYKFRARLRAESAYPYELGYSRIVSVKVRGR